MATYSSILAWKIPWTEEPGGLQSMGSLKVGHNWATSLSLFTFHFPALEKEMATHSSVLAWRIPGMAEPAVYGVAQSQTRLKWLSSSIPVWELPRWLSGKESTCQSRRHGFDPWVEKIPWRRKWHPTPVFLPGKSHRQRNLVRYSPWGCKELDTTKQLSNSIPVLHLQKEK